MAKYFRPEELKLSNGIPVILQHYEGPVAATYWWIQTGSSDEKPEETGFAHFLEHMLFKDAAAKETGRSSTGKMARTIESLGGDINAYTSFDQTVYHVTCAAQHWEKVIDTFGVMADQQKFSPDDFEREREVILEELRKNEDSPGRQLFQNLFSATFSKHPYGRPVIGFSKILKSAKVKDVEAFFKRNYIPEKMGLILVGPWHDVKGSRKKALLQILERRYGSKVFRAPARPTESKPRLRVSEPEFRKKAEWRVQPFDVKTPSLSLSFRVPDLAHPDIPALDLLSSILGMGELSRLYQNLFNKNKLVTDVSSGLFVPKDPGMMYVQAEADSMDKLEAVTREIMLEIKRIQKEGPTAEELSRVVVNAESERMYATQTADGMAGRIGFLRFIMGDLSFDQHYLEELRSVDSARIQQVAQHYFNDQRMSGVVLVPKSESQYSAQKLARLSTELLAANVSLPQESKKSQKSNQVSQVSDDPLEIRKFSSGLTVCFYPRPQSHVFSIHASTLGGLRLEVANPVESADSDWGSSYFLAHTWPKGTSKLDSREILAITEGHASSLEGFSGRNSIGLQMTGLARDWKILSNVFKDVLLDPVFPKEEVDHARRITEDSIRSVEDHSSQLCSKLFLETLFEQHPYGKMTHGSLESIKHIHSDKLKSFHNRWIRPERLVVSISGAVPRSLFEAFASELDDQMKGMSSKFSPVSFPERLPDEGFLKAPRLVERSLGREQSHILIGSLGTYVHAEDRHALRLLQMLLGGQGGRLFLELREKRSLAYTVAPVNFEGLERGYIGTYIACAPDKREQAISGIRGVLEKLADKGPSMQEMKRTKEFFLGRRAMDLQGDSSIASHYGLEALYKIPHLSEQALIPKIQAITSKQIQTVCKKYFVDPQKVTSVVG